MNKQRWISAAIITTLLVVITLFGYQRWGHNEANRRADLLAAMPTDASAVIYFDLAELRSSPFLAQVYQWAPRPQADVDYAQFVRDTGFDFERDLDRVAVAVEKHNAESVLFAVADGRFDRKKISAYAAKFGNIAKRDGHEVFSVPVSGTSRQISFTLVNSSRILMTDDTDVAAYLGAKRGEADAAEWRSRFERLAGSPIFAVIRQDAGAGSTLTAQAPGGLRSPQLSALLDQLQWITLAGRPQNENLRVVAEGECAADATARQLADVLNGIVILAQAGLNDAKTRQQLDPAARDAYLELLKNADISKIDRGETKSVRVIIDLTPKFLEAARTTMPTAPPAVVPQKPAGKAATKR